MKTNRIILAGLLLTLSIVHTACADEQAQAPKAKATQPATPGSIQMGAADQQNPFDQVREVQDDLERVFRNIMGDQLATFPNTKKGPLGGFTYSPDLDVFETDKNYRIELDLPGMQKDQINVEVQGGVLTISGERKRRVVSNGGTQSYQGRSYAPFSHSTELPKNADENKISAEYEQGVLILTILKKVPGPAPKPKKIAVQ